MTEHLKAKRWREKTKLSVAELAEKAGYSIEAVYLFEKGFTYDARGKDGKDKIRTKPHDDRAWRRYRMACAGVAAELGGQRFRW